ncbi:MAG: 2,3-bisphosphoglycerate-independent phosphoglycerate mutase [Bacillota bacterium]|jgi:2,3-bisphosphoglycerate-independent phosphoglycerate mutase
MKKPVILVIMDGYGIRKETYGNAIAKAKKPNLDKYFAKYPYTQIQASGLQVGLPEGQMGNSEVGHLNIGAGRIVYQSLTLIDQAIKDGSFYQNPKYLAAMQWAKSKGKKLHIVGLVSDGGVHSHLTHLQAIIKLAAKQEVPNVYFHALMDGRDVAPQLGESYIQTLLLTMKEYKTGQLASIGGRYYAMDRDKNLQRVAKAYDAMVEHRGLSFKDYRQYFKDQYLNLPKEGKDPSDEFLIPAYAEGVQGKIEDGDAVIFMNFRPDRAIQFCTLLTNPSFYANPPIKDGKPSWVAYQPNKPLKNLMLVQTMKYADSVKGEIAFKLPSLDNTLGPWLASHGKTQLRIAETEKYPHVTFFFDGTINYDGVEKPELPGSRRVLITSPKVATYDLQPEMSAYQVRDALIKELNKGDLDVVIINYANCDMVGHTAVEKAVIKSVEVVDECVGSIIDWCDRNGGKLIVTADHGNADQILTDDGKPHTAHTTNLVPVCINIPGLRLMPTGGKLGNLAPTILDLLGLEKPIEMTEKSLIIK